MAESKEDRNRKNREWMKADKLKHPEKHKARAHRNYLKHKDKIIEKVRDWKKADRLQNPEKYRIAAKEYDQKNADKIRIRKRGYQRERLKHDVQFRIRRACGQGLRAALITYKGTRHVGILDLIGCSVGELKEHIASKFIDGMSWENYGLKTWHIDHIIPVSLFDLTDFEQQKKCFHFSNLQPLFSRDNIIKGNKVSTEIRAYMRQRSLI